jgi:hypothetical protein
VSVFAITITTTPATAAGRTQRERPRRNTSRVETCRVLGSLVIERALLHCLSVLPAENCGLRGLSTLEYFWESARRAFPNQKVRELNEERRDSPPLSLSNFFFFPAAKREISLPPIHPSIHPPPWRASPPTAALTPPLAAAAYLKNTDSNHHHRRE